MIAIFLFALIFFGCREEYIRRNGSSDGFFYCLLGYFFIALFGLAILNVSPALLVVVIAMYIAYNIYRDYKEA